MSSVRTHNERPRKPALLALVLPLLSSLSLSDLALSSAPARGGTRKAETVRYGRDVRRILSDRCFQCHGADSGARQADLRLDQRASAIQDRGGYAAIVPGDPSSSELWRRINHTDPNELMPPPRAKKRPLSGAERALLERWIEEGAEYESHWAFSAPTRPDLPQSATASERAWPRNPIDHFVLARMQSAGVSPSKEADPATLLRRLLLDLTGLPPTVEELDEFLEDEGADAYERVVERIFAEEPYRSRLAERLTAPWLDAARYADTIGIHTDGGRQMWSWRDWVLEALRDNMPYDRFVTEQLAGDLLPAASIEQKIASGFNRNHVITDEAGVIPAEYLLEYAVDRVTTTSSVFLGLTMGCARCHDHKYDPVTQEDFYSLVAFFNSVDEPGLYNQTPDSNRAYEPFMEVPSPQQEARVSELEESIEELEQQLELPVPGEQGLREGFAATTIERSGAEWSTPAVRSAESSEDEVTLRPKNDGSILAVGPQPDFEDYTLVVKSDTPRIRAILIEALATEGKGPGAGRASHGNAVVTGISVGVRPAPQAAEGRTADWSPVPLRWAWSDHTQMNRDFEPTNVIDPEDGRGWAADGNESAGARNLLLLTEEEIGFAQGSELRIELAFRSTYPAHSLGRIRIRTAALEETSLLPVALGRWYRVGPFGTKAIEKAYETAYGPESLDTIELEHPFGADELEWSFAAKLKDDEVVSLGSTKGATYVGRTIWSPDTRSLKVSLGSDDGFRLYLNGQEVAGKKVDRGVAADQDEARLELQPGANTLVFKIINTGGPTGYYFSPRPKEDVLVGELASALLPPDTLSELQAEDFTRAWRRSFSEDYLAKDETLKVAQKELKQTQKAIPRAMIMRELAEARETFVLERGQYDHPDESRPVTRRAPAILPPLPADAPADRLGLAQWLFAPENPLVARVAVNRFWGMIFGAGLVRTSQDFGLQGEWPTHPELLDWLAVEFRESGWDLQALLRELVLSSTYRQASRVRSELQRSDPENRLLAYYPRRRLSAEQIRDQALYAAGLLAETLGGPSVKPYQPEGLWGEVAMPASNTKLFERGEGEDLWRRSLYVYWKRAAPPPNLQTFDAPTRESCIIRRQSTNTPLQALVLWNDEQFVEAARVLAERILKQEADEPARLERLFRTCTGRRPEESELELLREALAGFRARFEEQAADARNLLSVGQAERAQSTQSQEPGEPSEPELAAWSMLASGVLCLHETLTQD